MSGYIVDAHFKTIKNVQNPRYAGDLANKLYVDNRSGSGASYPLTNRGDLVVGGNAGNETLSIGAANETLSLTSGNTVQWASNVDLTSVSSATLQSDTVNPLVASHVTANGAQFGATVKCNQINTVAVSQNVENVTLDSNNLAADTVSEKTVTNGTLIDGVAFNTTDITVSQLQNQYADARCPALIFYLNNSFTSGTTANVPIASLSPQIVVNNSNYFEIVNDTTDYILVKRAGRYRMVLYAPLTQCPTTLMAPAVIINQGGADQMDLQAGQVFESPSIFSSVGFSSSNGCSVWQLAANDKIYPRFSIVTGTCTTAAGSSLAEKVRFSIIRLHE